ILARVVNKMYPYLKNKVIEKIDPETKNGITKNVKAIILQNTGNFLVNGTDNIIISSFISVAAVGLYSNYHMLIEIFRNLLNQIFNNIYHSVGNLVAKEDSEKVYSIFKVYRFLNFWLYSFISIFLLIILDSFITVWIGSEFLMAQNALIIVMLIFFERGMRNAITTIKTTAGIFHEDRYIPLFQAAINLILSIVLVQYMGIAGVFIGTLVSTIVGPFWTTPYLVYKKVLNRSLYEYYLTYIFFVLIGVGAYFLTNYLCNFIEVEGFLGLLLIGMICFIVPNIIYLIIFYKTSEFKYLLSLIIGISGSLLQKIKIKNSQYKMENH
ncbi:oligosaccharide flippase family protein, partial [Bacillus sp. JJ634]